MRITLDLQPANLSYFEQRAKQEGVTVSELVDRMAAFLRRIEQRPIHPDVMSLVGNLKEPNVDEARDSYLRSKYQ